MEIDYELLTDMSGFDGLFVRPIVHGVTDLFRCDYCFYPIDYGRETIL